MIDRSVLEGSVTRLVKAKTLQLQLTVIMETTKVLASHYHMKLAIKV